MLTRFALDGASQAARVAQRFSATFGSGRDPGVPGSSPTSGSLHGACFSLCHVSSLFVCLSWINKIKKEKKEKKEREEREERKKRK